MIEHHNFFPASINRLLRSEAWDEHSPVAVLIGNAFMPEAARLAAQTLINLRD